MSVLHLTGPVLVGPAETVPEAWVVGGRTTFTAPSGSWTSVPGWVVPGLVDAHCHVGLGADGEVPQDVAEQQALADRDAGTLLLRDAGSPADTRWVDDRPDLPVIVRAGRHVARPKRYLRGFGVEVEPSELAAEVARQAARADGWVKLVGDWIDRSTGDLGPCWPLEALREAVAVAHAAGARVTAHCFGEECLPDLLEAGVDGIEHGTGIGPDLLPVLASRQVSVVPTLINIATFPSIAASGEARFPAYAAHMRALHARRYETVAALHEAGVPVFAGTDAGGSLPHGLLVSEIEELAAAGLPAVDALSAGCWSARDWLGQPGLVEGASADLLVLPGDPRSDLSLLRSAVVVLRGERVRG